MLIHTRRCSLTFAAAAATAAASKLSEYVTRPGVRGLKEKEGGRLISTRSVLLTSSSYKIDAFTGYLIPS